MILSVSFFISQCFSIGLEVKVTNGHPRFGFKKESLIARLIIFLSDTVVLLSKDGNKTYMKFTHFDGIAPCVAKQFRHCNASMVLVQQLFSHRVRLDHGGDLRRGLSWELAAFLPCHGRKAKCQPHRHIISSYYMPMVSLHG